jgi:transposase
MLRGWGAFLTGEWAAARQDLERAAAIGREVGPFFGSAFLPLALGSFCLAEGADAEASDYLAEGEHLLLPGSGFVYPQRQVACALAASDLLAGRPDEARARLAALLEGAMPELDVAHVQSLLAQALLDLDEVVEAATLAWRAVARAREQGRQVLLVDALRVAASVAARRGRGAEAEAALLEGLALARRLGYPYGEARALQVYGGLFTQLGQPEPARARLAEALALFQRLGARTDIARAEQALVSLFQYAPPSRNAAARSMERRVSAAQWAAIAPLLPLEAHTGRPRADDCQTITAILYKLETGCAWRSIPAEFGAGVTAYRRWRAWVAAGVWARILAIMRDGRPSELSGASLATTVGTHICSSCGPFST